MRNLEVTAIHPEYVLGGMVYPGFESEYLSFMEAHSQPLASAVHPLGCRTATESYQRLRFLREQDSMGVNSNIINGEGKKIKKILPYALPKAGSPDHSAHSPQTGIKCSFLGCWVSARNIAFECKRFIESDFNDSGCVPLHLCSG